MRYLLLMLFVGLSFSQIPWPHPPQDQIHPIGNSWGNFQSFDGMRYVHNGIDIITPPRWPVTAVRDGYVKRIWRFGELYTGITIADSAGAGFCSGYMYFHLEEASIRVREGDTVYVGDTIALIVPWPVAEFHHNHFSKNRNQGIIWQDYGGFFKNPLTELLPDDDSTLPVFTDAVPGQVFAICQNNTSRYLRPDSIYGDVDLICRFEDKINHPIWRCAIYKIIYSIIDSLGDTLISSKLGIQFSCSINAYHSAQVRVIYKEDNTCRSYWDYRNPAATRLYYIFTNSDGDSLIEATDSLECWRTTSVPNGPYLIKVSAFDEYGNRRDTSMLVRVKNLVGIKEDEKEPKEEMLLWATPNPTSLRIFSKEKEVQLRIYQASGRLVKRFNGAIDQIIFDRHDEGGRVMPAGVYFVEVKSKSGLKRIKIVIQ